MKNDEAGEGECPVCERERVPPAVRAESSERTLLPERR